MKVEEKATGQTQGTPSPAEVAAFAQSAGFFGFDRRQTRRFLQTLARRLAELEGEVEAGRGKEAAIGEALVTASATAQSIVADATARAGQLEATARARIEKLEADSRAARLRAVEDLERASFELGNLVGILSSELGAVESASGLPDVTVSGSTLAERRIEHHAS